MARDPQETAGGDDVDELGFDEGDDLPTPQGAPDTLAQKRRAQKARFESWLQSDAAQQDMKRQKIAEAVEAEDVEDVRKSINYLMARQESAEIVKNPREYQMELFERAKKQNTIAVLETGSGKTLIAVLLIRWIIDQELEARAKGAPPRVAFFLVASVTLVFQQFAVLETNLDHKIARFCGSSNVNAWSKAVWDGHFAMNKVIVCTADILLQCLSHSYINMKQINLLVFDEAHHTKKNHAYARIIKDYYLQEPDPESRPRVFGMTASPIDSKGDVVQAAQELEGLLQSRIATTTDMSFQEVVKSKDEKFMPYCAPCQPFDTEFLAAVKARFNHVVAFRKIFDTASEVAAELGSWCADQFLVRAFVEKKLRKYEALIERQFHANNYGRPMSYLDNLLADVKKASIYIQGRARMSPLGAPRDQHLSAKVKELRDYLSREFERPSGHRCLVFVNKRSTAQLLATLFQQLKLGYMQSGFLIGGTSSNLDEDNFTFKQQVLTLIAFRKGELNCLFATSVAEEGLDVPDCNLVIRFDLYLTMVQYVQSRGRARQTNSRFVHMVEAGNSIQWQLIQEVRAQEVAMKSLCRALPEDRRLVGSEDVVEEMMAKEANTQRYIDKETGATLNYSNALTYLANFVTAIPTNSEEPQYPTYATSSVGTKFVTEVMLPSGSPVRSAIGRVQVKKSLAKRSAAFAVCLELRQKNYLDQHLMPTYVKKLPAMQNALLAVNMKKTLKYDMRVKPDVWQQSRGTTPRELYITVIHFSNGLEYAHQPLAFLTRTPVPQLPSFPIFLKDGKESQVVSTALAKALSVSPEQVELLTTFTFRVFKDVFNKVYERIPANLSYWLAPLAVSEVRGNTDPRSCLDWPQLEAVSKTDVHKWTAEMPNSDLQNRFLIDPWEGGNRFISKWVTDKYKPLDPVPEGTAINRKHNKNILDYSNNMWKKSRDRNASIWDLNQPVMETEKILTRRNMLAPPNAKEVKGSSQAFLCPQPLEISSLNPGFAVSCFVWPAIIWRLESYMIALEATKMLGVDCDPVTALAAVTKDSDNSGDHEATERVNFQHGMGSNYERLEFIGDCFLKTATTVSTFIQNPNDNEFEFHVKRMLMLCNKNLFEVAKKLKLYEYIRSQAFNKTLWYPEGLNLLSGRGIKKTGNGAEQSAGLKEAIEEGTKHTLGEKTIADVCEAMIGAAFMSHDKPGAWHPDQWENAVTAVTTLVDCDDHRMLKWDDYRAAYNIPAYQTAEATASQNDMADKVALEDNYRFRHPRLLRSAFIHPSQPFLWEKLPNYQRLEFLGDALLDQASITHIFNKFPDKDPQWLTEHKMAMIGNRALGMIAVVTGFYKHIRHNHSTIELQIRDYATELLEAKRTAGADAKDYWTTLSEPPKCLADIVEAYVGAMFIDSDFDYGQVQRFFDSHIQPHFEDMSLYDTYASNHPCTHLHNLLQTTYGCQEYRLMARELPMQGDADRKDVVAVVMIHDEIFSHSKGKSGRYTRLRAAKLALEQLEGLAPYEFRLRFGCNCKVGEGGQGEEMGKVQADCAL